MFLKPKRSHLLLITEHVNAIRERLSGNGNPAVLGEVKKCLEKTTQVKAIL